MVVVFKIEHIPAASVESFLPGAERLFQLAQRKRTGIVVDEKAVGAHALELNHHIKVALIAPDIIQSFFRADERRFTDGDAVEPVQRLAAELLKVFVDMRTVVVETDAAGGGHQPVAGQTLFL